MKRIVVTGMGLVTPLGCGVETAWSRLLAGRSGMERLPESVVEGLPAKTAGIVRSVEDDLAGFNIDAVVDAKDRKKMDRFIHFALAAAAEALTMAKWEALTDDARVRTATVIASGVGGFGAIAEAVRTTYDKGPRRLSPFTVPSFIANMAAAQISIRHGFQGPSGTPVTACAASVQAIGDAMRLIQSGEADIAVCGGAEACIDRVTIGSFSAARALSTHHAEEPSKASRPFDAQRDGFVMGEGAGVLVIEDLEHALRRGARPIVEVTGYGTTSDAYHMTSTLPDGAGAQRAMTLALHRAGIRPEEVQHLNAHATSTPMGDRSELHAIRAVFGDASPAVSATKSSTGHLLGAAGGVEAIFTALAIRDQIAPATLNFEEPDEIAKGIDIVHGNARKMKIENAISNGFGFGGVNASVIFRQYTNA
ncbi:MULTISPECIES: beta-ketoacyl-ACP synthase II [unclassified Cupriavidus]|uniref:beta-ketoacyl-ACP synthase II n=1 Tax=unclassified Cupriavidus TaxID=2640874 RepID=UPI00313BA02D